jgi:DNA modification methylase
MEDTQASKSLGLETVPVVIADLSPEKAKAYRIADNKTNEYSDWDIGLLQQEFTDLLDINYDLELTGFDADELEKLIVGEKDGLTDEDAVPETPEEPKAQLGDIYKLGEHRLMCGDSTKIDDVDKLMEGTYPDLIHTDPPYGMNAVSKSGVLSKNYKTDIKGDDDNSIAKDCFNLIYGLYPKAKQIWWGANYYSSCLPDSECWLVWDKNNGNSDQTDCELAWANFRSVVRQFTQSSEKTNRVHPTQKPVSLMEWIIKRFKLNATTIADVFGGSGSTMIACEKKLKTCYMMEYEPKYVDVIIKRWEDFTGQKAEKIN